MIILIKILKSYYNQYLISLLPDVIDYIDDDLKVALKLSILGNLIDFSAKDYICKDDIIDCLFKAKGLNLTIDDSDELFNALSYSHTLLYLGDNCGEIVLDKLLLTMIAKCYPRVSIYYGVRGKPIVNDVTLEDCYEVGMQDIAYCISNGDGSLGTVIDRTSYEFQDIFNRADIIICKGQGNFEGLLNCNKKNIFFMFMVKCQLIARITQTSINNIVCMRNHRK